MERGESLLHLIGGILDLILRLAIRREGLFHLAVFPVVLSMHLFVWFEREDFWLGFLNFRLLQHP